MTARVARGCATSTQEHCAPLALPRHNKQHCALYELLYGVMRSHGNAHEQNKKPCRAAQYLGALTAQQPCIMLPTLYLQNASTTSSNFNTQPLPDRTFHRTAQMRCKNYAENSNDSAIITTAVLSYCCERLLVTYPSDHRALRPRARRADVQVVSAGLCQSRRLRRG